MEFSKLLDVTFSTLYFKPICCQIYLKGNTKYKYKYKYIYIDRWRRSIQAAKKRLGVDCGSDHELLIAKFRL